MIAGDGCLMEGVNHEAVGLAGHLKLGRLIVLWDDNEITIDGPTDLSRNEDVVARHRRRMAWDGCDGLDSDDVSRAIEEAKADPRPSLIRCKTIIGYRRAEQAGHGGDARRCAGQGRGRGRTRRTRSSRKSSRSRTTSQRVEGVRAAKCVGRVAIR